MFVNREHCTIYEKTVVNRAPAYIRHELPAVYWENTEKQDISGTSRNSENQFLCIIPESSLTYFPKKDDRILDFLCTDETPPNDAPTVMTVKNFLYGSAKVRHIEVIAE